MSFQPSRLLPVDIAITFVTSFIITVIISAISSITNIIFVSIVATKYKGNADYDMIIIMIKIIICLHQCLLFLYMY